MPTFDPADPTSSLFDQPWAITREKLRELVAVFGWGDPWTPPPRDVLARFAAARREADRLRLVALGGRGRSHAGMFVAHVNGVAIVPVFGLIVQRPDAFTAVGLDTSAEQLAAAHEALVNDGSVKAVVWLVDSPGGGVAGVPEAAARLLELRGRKRTVALSDTTMASAAYWLAAAADEVVSAPSAMTGNIGVCAALEFRHRRNDAEGIDVEYIHAGKYKVEGFPDKPLTDEGRAAIQQTVDDYYGMFTRHVAKARKVSEGRVRGGYGEGRALTADRAKDAGLVDRVATLTAVLRDLGAFDDAPRPGREAGASGSRGAATTDLARRQRQMEFGPAAGGGTGRPAARTWGPRYDRALAVHEAGTRWPPTGSGGQS